MRLVLDTNTIVSGRKALHTHSERSIHYPHQLALGLFNDKKEEEKVTLAHLDDLYKYADQLKATVSLHIPKEASV